MVEKGSKALKSKDWERVNRALKLALNMLDSAQLSLKDMVFREDNTNPDPRNNEAVRNRKAQRLFRQHYLGPDHTRLKEVRRAVGRVRESAYDLKRKSFRRVSNALADKQSLHLEPNKEGEKMTWGYVREGDSHVYFPDRYFKEEVSIIKGKKPEETWLSTNPDRAELIIHETSHLALGVHNHPGFARGGAPAPAYRPGGNYRANYKKSPKDLHAKNAYVLSWYVRSNYYVIEKGVETDPRLDFD